MRFRSWSVPALVVALVLSMIAVPAAAQETPPDACPDGADPAGFDDVSDDNVHAASIDCAVQLGIASGTSTSPALYSPAESATRAQIATMIVQALEAAGLELPDAEGQPFDDVSGVHADNIAKLAMANVVRGRGEGEFAPNRMVTRAQMATMVQQAHRFALGLPSPAEGGPHFDDTGDSVHEDNIDAGYELGLMIGRSDSEFAPGLDIRRDQLASVVTRLFGAIGEFPEADFELSVLHINDGESALLPNAEAGFPGAARFVNDIKQMQVDAEGEDSGSLTVSSGDNFLAGPRFAASEADPDAFYDAIVYNEANFDAMTIGNHEFDFGPDTLVEFIEAVDADIPFLSANLDFSGEADLAALESDGRIAASHVVEVDGRDVGVIGATYEGLDDVSSPRNVVANEVLPAVQAEVADLQADGVEHIVLSSHLQDLNEELTLIPSLSGVDAVVGGGGGEELRDEYPLFAEDADGNHVPVVTTPGNYTDIGRLQLGFDADGDLVRIGTGSRLVPVPLEGDTDATVVSEVEDPVAAYVEGLDENVIATTDVPLDGRRDMVRSRETNLGDLMADALLTTARDRAADFGIEEADVALQNGGGMRSDAVISAGDVTELDTFDIAAFSNIVSVIELDGEELAAALEWSVSDVPDPTGHHGQWAGVEFEFDTSAAAGERITDATVTMAEGTEVDLIVDGSVEAGSETFTLASIDFLLGGNDGYEMFDGDFETVGRTYQQALADYFDDLGTVTEADYPDLTVDADAYLRFGPVGSVL